MSVSYLQVFVSKEANTPHQRRTCLGRAARSPFGTRQRRPHTLPDGGDDRGQNVS